MSWLLFKDNFEGKVTQTAKDVSGNHQTHTGFDKERVTKWTGMFTTLTFQHFQPRTLQETDVFKCIQDWG